MAPDNILKVEPGHKVGDDTVLYLLIGRGRVADVYLAGQTLTWHDDSDLFHSILAGKMENRHRLFRTHETLESYMSNYNLHKEDIGGLEDEERNLLSIVSGEERILTKEDIERVKKEAGLKSDIRFVAVKFFSTLTAGRDNYETYKRLFETEMKVLPNLHHQNIVDVKKTFSDKNGLYLVEEFVDGRNLWGISNDLLNKGLIERAVDYQTVLSIGYYIAKALEHCHKEEVLHRDITPNNIIVGYNGSVKLTDFGVSIVLGFDKRKEIVGTPEYISPAQIKGDVDNRNDLYMLSSTMYHLMTGNRPYLYNNNLRELWQLKQRMPVSMKHTMPDIPPDVDRAVMGCLHPNLERFKFKTAAELVSVFYDLLKRDGVYPEEKIISLMKKIERPLYQASSSGSGTLVEEI